MRTFNQWRENVPDFKKLPMPFELAEQPIQPVNPTQYQNQMQPQAQQQQPPGPAMPQQPIQQQSAQQTPRVRLSDIANKVKDTNWHQMYGQFAAQYRQSPQDPKTQQLGQALYHAGTTGNMSLLQPYRMQMQQQGQS